MQLPVQITWREVKQSPAIEADIREKVAKLEQFCDQIISCRVVVHAPHKHHHKGNLFGLHLDIRVPDKEIVVTREPSAQHAHEDMYVVVRDAFDAARRQLQDYMRVRQRHVKHHAEHHPARILRLFPEQDYGFLVTPDGREVYFHRNSVVNAEFGSLREGVEVGFVEEMGEQGPQARQVTLGRHATARPTGG